MVILTKREKINNFLELLDLPDPMKSLEDWEKLLTIDLDKMTDLELWREGKRLENKLSIIDPKVLSKVFYLDGRGELLTAEAWLRERLIKINQRLRQTSKVNNSPLYAQIQGRAEGWT